MMVIMIKKRREQKKCIIKRVLKFNDYKNCLLNNEIILKSQQKFKNKEHSVCTEKNNKITLSSNDYQRWHTFDKIASYP